MARKRLIKGVNAARVEERIARVPEDLAGESNIFRALKALESAPAGLSAPARKAASPRERPSAEPGKLKAPKRPAARSAAPASPPPSAPASHPARALPEAPTSPATPSSSPAAEPHPRQPDAPALPRAKRIGPSDFSLAEREAIVRCCADYRNRLPIYLLAVRREVEIIDSVIEKCEQVRERGRQRRLADSRR